MLWVASIGLWAALALADALDYYVGWRMGGTPKGFGNAMAASFPGWMLWVAIAPVVFWLAGRVPVTRRPRLQAVALHLGAGLVVAALHAAVHTGARLAFGVPMEGMGLLGEYETTLLDWAPITLLIYWSVVAVRLGVDAYLRFRSEEVRSADLARRLADARFEALSAQLRPHFLFNALNAAVALVRTGDNATAARVLTDLGEILRHLLHGAEHAMIPLREELEFLRRYLDVEQVRFSDRLAVRFQVPADLLDTPVPNLILQPLVENAIRHGLSTHDRQGTVTVSASTDGVELRLAVRDDGPGLPAGWTWDTIGIGLSNTRSRLRHLYGDQGRLSLAGAAPTGVDAVVRIPLEIAARG